MKECIIDYYNPIGAVESSQTKVFFLDRNGLKQPNHLLLRNQDWVGAERAGIAYFGMRKPWKWLNCSLGKWIYTNFELDLLYKFILKTKQQLAETLQDYI